MKYNFSAGPAILPKEVIEEASNAVINYNNSGFSILEVSHRGKDFVQTMEEAKSLVRELFQLTDDYEVLFLSGGASSQFYMVPMNILNDEDEAGYVNTGVWASGAIKEAKAYGKINVLASSESSNFNHVPKGYDIPENLRYLHLTSNNTIYGTQLHQWPETDVSIVCDMSSDIFSRPIDIHKFGLIYAGAQKNMGPAGTTLVVIRKDMLKGVNRYIPSMLKYETHIKGESMYNTPPVYPIYVSMLTLRWIKKMGGLTEMEKRNKAKAKVIYDAIDRSNIFSGHSVEEDRSLMNVSFKCKDKQVEDEFLKICETEGLDGLKGHRSVGGLRASIYNAMEIETVKVLAELMNDFENKKG